MSNDPLTILNGDCLEALRRLPDNSVQCCVTSPPYWGLRDYGVAGQIGREPTPAEYIQKMVTVFEEVRRVLREDGTLWLNIGDSYAGSGRGSGDVCSTNKGNGASRGVGSTLPCGLHENARAAGQVGRAWVKPPPGLKNKDLVGIPWMVAFALRDAGWWLRQDIVWAKPNPMPESVTDRCTRSHEYLFMFSKSPRYYYDQEAIKEPMSLSSEARLAQDVESQAGSLLANGGAKTNGPMKAVRGDKQRGHSRRHSGFNDRWDKMEREQQCTGMRNKRSVWTVAPANYDDAHFATFPTELITPPILAGSKPGDVVLDPFGGSGTTGAVAIELGRKAILIELNPEYCALIRRRCTTTIGLPLA